MSPAAPVFQIAPTVQQYDWGKPGISSKVAQFARTAGISDFSVTEDAPYAELWMGTHPKSPSRVPSLGGQTLQEHLAAHPELIGDDVVKKFNAANGNLPFLFKVLAIAKALSIQSHPDKKTAEKLHAEQPDIYKDPNHKPEMALALTPFTALCGFLPLPQIARFLSITPEFAALIPPAISQRFVSLAGSKDAADPEAKQALKDVFSAVMTASEADFKAQLKTLVQRYRSGGEHADEKVVKRLVLTLQEQFPDDIGIFCVYLLNYVELKPGEAIYLGAGEPHAYVSGDIMECMANSDNVIRAGLTPKLRDVPNLVSTLTYQAAPSTKHKVQPSPFTSDQYTTLYDPPIPEFSVLQVVLPAGKTEKHRPVHGPSIAIVTGGDGAVSWGGQGEGSLTLVQGSVFFIGAGVDVEFTAGEGELVVYRAFVEA
ncbi:mannose-6-phosphate isomerase [Dentipellis sp. KUC8613]|nr:mannose-6-phosphate isomerase [Dentipellis sp. KUC8613]